MKTEKRPTAVQRAQRGLWVGFSCCNETVISCSASLMCPLIPFSHFLNLFLLSFHFSSLVLSFLSSTYILLEYLLSFSSSPSRLLRSALVPLWISAFFFHILSFLWHMEEGTVCRRCCVGSLGFWNGYQRYKLLTRSVETGSVGTSTTLGFSSDKTYSCTHYSYVVARKRVRARFMRRKKLKR